MTMLAKPRKVPGQSAFLLGSLLKAPPAGRRKALDKAFLGRSHRAKDGKARLKLAIEKTKQILGIPAGYHVGIVPGSDTGAFEMAMWSLLGERGVDALAWESFGDGWITDAVKQLKLKDCRTLKAGYGDLPKLSDVDFSRDVLFTANGTTSGVNPELRLDSR